jgi:hypothetical protein
MVAAMNEIATNFEAWNELDADRRRILLFREPFS